MNKLNLVKRQVNIMNLSNYKVAEIRYAHSKFKLAQLAIINDEGSFYRIDSTHIIDKFRIQSMKLEDNQLTIHMNDQDVILIVEERK